MASRLVDEKCFVEPIDVDRAQRILHYAAEHGVPDDDKEQLRRLLKSSASESTVHTKYKEQDGHLRAVNQASLQHMSAKLRATVCKDQWVCLSIVDQRHKLPACAQNSEGAHDEEADEADEEMNDPAEEYADMMCDSGGTYCDPTPCQKHPGEHALAARGVDPETTNLTALYVAALYTFLEKNGAGNCCVLCTDGVMIHKSKRAYGSASNQDFLSQAGKAIGRTVDKVLAKNADEPGFKNVQIKVENKPFTDGYELPDDFKRQEQKVQDLCRELALQGKPTGDPDANVVIEDVITIFVGQSGGEDHGVGEVYEAIIEFLRRACCDNLGNLARKDFDNFMHKRRQPPPTRCDIQQAWDTLWTRRQQRPLLLFKTDTIINARDDIVKWILQNINTQSTDAATLVLLVRLLARNNFSHDAVLNFLQMSYTKAECNGLHDVKIFAQVWGMPTPRALYLYFAPALKNYLEMTLEAHPFIRSTLPRIMNKPVKCYTVDGGGIQFQLDFEHYSKTMDGLEPVQYQLDYTTGEITSSSGQGVIHHLYNNVRRYFSATDGIGIQSLAELALAEKFGAWAQYDADQKSWKVNVPSSSIGSIWRLASTEEVNSNLSRFLKKVFETIQHLAEFAGTDKFDWLSGSYAPVDVGDDCESESDGTGLDDSDDSTDGKATASKKRSRKQGVAGADAKTKKVKTTKTTGTKVMRQKINKKNIVSVGDQSFNSLQKVMLACENPKHLVEVLKIMQHSLSCSFPTRSTLLPAKNTWKKAELLVQSSPDSIQTRTWSDCALANLVQCLQQVYEASSGAAVVETCDTGIAEQMQVDGDGDSTTSATAVDETCDTGIAEQMQVDGDGDSITHSTDNMDNTDNTGHGSDTLVMVWKEHCTVFGISPKDDMATALVQNLHPSVDWRLVVAWTCMLVVYQAVVATATQARPQSVWATEASAQDQVTTLPQALADYRDGMHGLPGAPTSSEFDDAYEQTRKRINNCMTSCTSDKSACMLLCRALWSVCFDRLFSYQAAKSEFEKNHFRLGDSKNIAAINSTGQVKQHTPAALASSSKSYSYWGIVGPNVHTETMLDSYILESGLENGKYMTLPFIKRWLEDTTASTYDRIDSIPPSRNQTTQDVTPAGVFNTWPGFRAADLPLVQGDEVLPLVQPILDHIRNVITGDEHLNYLLAWLAQQVQDPAQHTTVAIVLQGLEGVGKDIIFDFFLHKVLGDRVGFKTSNPKNDIFGEHSVALRDRVFLLVDEAKGDEIRPLMSRLKDLVTSSIMHVNPKNQPAYDVLNLANLLFTTNTSNPIQIDPKERRFVVFECNSSKKDDARYFGFLFQYLQRDDVARAFFQYLCDDVDVSPFLPLQAHRPRTDAYITMQQRNISPFFKFLSSEIQFALNVAQEEASSIKANEFFIKYKTWGSDGNYNIGKTTASTFGLDLKKLMAELKQADPLQGVLTKRRQGTGNVYRVRWAELQQHLERTARYDPNAE